MQLQALERGRWAGVDGVMIGGVFSFKFKWRVKHTLLVLEDR